MVGGGAAIHEKSRPSPRNGRNNDQGPERQDANPKQEVSTVTASVEKNPHSEAR